MGKKGKGGGGKKGGSGKKSTWEQITPPDGPMVVYAPVGQFLTLQVRGVVWRIMDFVERVPASMRVFELRNLISRRHGDGVMEFTLYKEEKTARNLLADPAATLGELEFSSSAPDTARVIYYDFEPRLDDCPLLLRAPHDIKIGALHRAEEEAKREKEARHAALRASHGGVTASPAR